MPECATKDYEVTQNLGPEQSVVVEGINVADASMCVIQISKPVKKNTITRKINILDKICRQTTIIQLRDVVWDL